MLDASIPALLLKGEPGAREGDHRMRLAVHAGLPKQLHREVETALAFNGLRIMAAPWAGP
jgi:hypothetical protein